MRIDAKLIRVVESKTADALPPFRLNLIARLADVRQHHRKNEHCTDEQREPERYDHKQCHRHKTHGPQHDSRDNGQMPKAGHSAVAECQPADSASEPSARSLCPSIMTIGAHLKSTLLQSPRIARGPGRDSCGGPVSRLAEEPAGRSGVNRNNLD